MTSRRLKKIIAQLIDVIYRDVDWEDEDFLDFEDYLTKTIGVSADEFDEFIEYDEEDEEFYKSSRARDYYDIYDDDYGFED